MDSKSSCVIVSPSLLYSGGVNANRPMLEGSATIKGVLEVSKELQSTGKAEYPCISTFPGKQVLYSRTLVGSNVLSFSLLYYSLMCLCGFCSSSSSPTLPALLIWLLQRFPWLRVVSSDWFHKGFCMSS